MTSRTPCHRRCCSWADASRARSRAPIALAIAYSQASLRSVYLFARQDDVRTLHFSKAMTTSTLILATLALRGYHLHVVLVSFYCSHNIRAIMMLQLWRMSAHRILLSTYFLVSPSVVLPL
jgi:hypothetical protein